MQACETKRVICTRLSRKDLRGILPPKRPQEYHITRFLQRVLHGFRARFSGLRGLGQRPISGYLLRRRSAGDAGGKTAQRQYGPFAEMLRNGVRRDFGWDAEVRHEDGREPRERVAG